MRISNDLSKVADGVGNFIKYWGFKKIDGMIWAHIFLAPKPLSAKDLMDRLKISKAQVSLSLKELLRFEVVVEAGKGDYGTMYYKSSEQLGTVIQSVLKNREHKMLSQILKDNQSLKQAFKLQNLHAQADEKQVQQLQVMLEVASFFLSQLFEPESDLCKLDALIQSQSND
jgi:DNA-binding transcriptional regulator GbsR (MarR family)